MASSAITGVSPRPARKRNRFNLPLKTTVILLTLLVGIVSLCGGIFIASARSMLRNNKNSQLAQLAYGVAAAMGDQAEPNMQLIGSQLQSLRTTPNLQFAMFTDTLMRTEAGLADKENLWTRYKTELNDRTLWQSTRVGQVMEYSIGKETSSVVTVPVFETTIAGEPGHLIGYLHVASTDESTEAQLRFLEAFVLLSCMGVVLIAVPIASLTARHITVPIQRLASAAHALATGDLSHRVNIRRSDELGELAEAFNRMADTVEEQQEAIKRINAGLEQKVCDRTAQLEKVNARLTAEMAEKEDFLRAVSHDLNAPLRNIAGMASMLILKYQNTLEKDALQRLERIQKNVEVECELINEILELSRIKTRREKIERVSLKTLVEGTADGFSSDLETRKITLNISGEFPLMHCEKTRLRQVFQNLIDNGIKYMRDDGPREITIVGKVEVEEILFSVTDTGMGIAPEDQPHLFHVFRRAKNASVMKIPGKGVGLASVKSIVENYNGRLWATSVPGQGTTFFVALPKNHFEIPKPTEVAA